MSKTRRQVQVLILLFSLLIISATLFAQETTGGLQGTVKDSSGAVVPGAKVTLTAPNLVGTKETTSDQNGYYRFTNLPPSTYTVTVAKENFATLKREGVTIEVGHLPTLDLPLQVGGSGTVVEVTEEAPLIDVTTTRTLTNITQDVIQDVPHGRSFQSVIQFAPAARNEPLAGSTSYQGNGSGGSSPGSTANGNDHGFQVAGGADSENSYLVEGQETANIIGGYSHTNVPFDFIQEVQTKSSGIEAEHGGALGGVVNVIMKKGSNQYHGSVFGTYESDALDGSPNAYARYDPLSNGTNTSWGTLDPAYQNYQPIKPHTSDIFPGFTFGGPILKDRIFGFVGFNPELNNYERFVNFGPQAGGTLPFSTNTRTYYTTARVDVAAGQHVRLFGSWLYQYQRQTGQALPASDSTNGLFNVSSGCFGTTTDTCLGGVPLFAYSHDLGYSAPNTTTNVGADITITPRLVATTRFGYYFENYHDFGYPTTGTIDSFASSGTDAVDTNGNPIGTSAPQLNHATGYFNLAQNINYTTRNANKAIQFDQDIAWFKSGWGGTHNFKFGYQMNRLSNDINQHYNTPYVSVYPGTSVPYSPQGSVGAANCAAVEAQTGDTADGCVGTYGVVNVVDYGSSGKATSYNHGFFAQDAWTIGHGITINAGVRFEREYLPAENQPSGANAKPINFGWGDKIAPRIGAAWDVFRDGRMKVFGSYGEFYDQMKLNLAISSYGGQYWQNCYYALMTPDLSTVTPVFDSTNRYCSGPDSSSQANFGGTTPAGLIFLENQNYRTFPTSCSTCTSSAEGTAPGIKPYKQHESVLGVDYAIGRNLAFEARWDRRRLDHVIEDAAIYNPNIGETFVIVNPGEGVARTFTDFWNFLYPTSPLTSDQCAPNPCPGHLVPAARSYDGVELRLTKAQGNHWFGMFSYTYSKLRGNYTGLTSTDVADGGGGRNAPNNSRSFDEPYFSWNALGGSSSGLLPTDRPNAFKGYAYYELPWLKHFTTDFGIFQFAYSGTPLTSYADVGYGFPGAFPVDIVNRGKWVDVTQDPTTGAVTVGNPYTRRTPWYTQTDFNLQQNWKISESKSLSFSATFTNLFNQRAVVSYGQQIDSNFTQQWINPQNSGCAAANTSLFGVALPDCYVFDGAVAYAAYAQPYDYKALLNQSALISQNGGGPITVNSQYSKPYLYQVARSIRLGIRFTF